MTSASRLTDALGKMLGAEVVHADCQESRLHGGTLGDVRLLTGTAQTAQGERLPFQLVLKTQKKWERYGDADSWRREYDLYRSDLGAAFTDSFRWPTCYRTEMDGDEIQLWMEYISGVSGNKLSVAALERAAYELGRFQGRLHRRPGMVQDITCLGDTGFMKREFSQWTPETAEYRYLHSDACALPEPLRETLIRTQREADGLFAAMECLPVVLCHRDFWLENIFLSDKGIRLIDWDTAGWGYIGEDLASLIADDTDADLLDETIQKLVPAYYKGLSEEMDLGAVGDFCLREMILIKFGYRMLQAFMVSPSPDVKARQVAALRKIDGMKDTNEAIRSAVLPGAG